MKLSSYIKWFTVVPLWSIVFALLGGGSFMLSTTWPSLATVGFFFIFVIGVICLLGWILVLELINRCIREAKKQYSTKSIAQGTKPNRLITSVLLIDAVYIALLYFASEFFFKYYAFLVSLIFFVIPLCVSLVGWSLVLALFFLRRKKTFAFWVIFSITVSTLLFFPVKVVIDHFEIRHFDKVEIPLNDQRGMEIVAALDAYKMKYQKYPKELNELVPEFLSQTPKLVNGQRFFYQNGENSFQVFYELPGVFFSRCYTRSTRIKSSSEFSNCSGSS